MTSSWPETVVRGERAVTAARFDVDLREQPTLPNEVANRLRQAVR